jgi:DNA invertase Pin-like site-specific DNA recombinase
VLDSHGVAWKSFTESYLDSTGMFKEAVIAILAAVAKQEHARLSERVVAGLRRAKREGKVLAGSASLRIAIRFVPCTRTVSLLE